MQTHTTEQISEHLSTNLGASYTVTRDTYGVYNLEVPVHELYRLVLFLYRDEVLGIQFLTDLCGVHYPESKGRELGVVYHLHGMRSGIRLRVKVFVPLEKPEVPSLTGIYASANWMERETYDFFGIRFAGHPDLRRILNMDEMTAFPLRKEYPLEDPTREDKADFQFGR